MDALLPSLPSLLILSVLEQAPAHGYQIARCVEAGSTGILQLKEGTLYPRLYQLERQGKILGRWGKTEAGRRVCLYEITESGRLALQAERAEWQKRAHAAETVLFGQGRTSFGTV